jgi:release factor glutamine methyltransferase
LKKIIEAITEAEQNLSEHGITDARFDARVLLSHVLKKDRAWVFTHIQDALDTRCEGLFQELVRRRTRREPLQYILGTQEFWGLEFKVSPDVLIPRPETELVVESAIGIGKDMPKATLIDLCTGSGCIAVSLAKTFRSPRIFATDTSERALRIAGENARNHEVREHIRFLEGDLFGPLQELDLRRQVDIITANPPYIPSQDLSSLQSEVKNFEPETALIAGPEGTEIHQRIITEAPHFLKKNGALIMEMGIGQAEKLVAMADAAGAYAKPKILKDLAGINRVIILQRK